MRTTPFPQRPAFETLIDMAREDEALIPLVVAMRATLWAQNDIYMRSRDDKSGFSHLCRVKSGGGKATGLRDASSRALSKMQSRTPRIGFRVSRSSAFTTT